MHEHIHNLSVQERVVDVSFPGPFAGFEWGVLLRFGWTKSGGPGALPRKNFGFKVPQPLFFLFF